VARPDKLDSRNRRKRAGRERTKRMRIGIASGEPH